MAPSRLLLRRSLVGLAALSTALVAATTTAQAAPAVETQEPGVTANLWEWNWDSIAAECPRLHTDGYDGVEVAPPQNSVRRTQKQADDPDNTGTAVLHPWWEVYQVVDYGLTSRMGDEKQFQTMVSACRSAGVKVYVDAVLNHTSGGQGTQSYGGNAFSPYTYPDAGYVPKDFHYTNGDCPSATGGIQDYNSRSQLWNCNLLGLEDLDTGSAKVRSTLATYLNKLLSYGVSGFRVDAAKHISPTDLDAIYAQLNKTKDGRQPYWTLEVGFDSPGTVTAQAYSEHGDVLGLEGSRQVFRAFKSYQGSGNVGDISGLGTFGSGSGLTASSKTLSFVTNHDTNHDQANALTYKDGSRYLLATEWLLADGYGSPQVFSSFTFGKDTNQSPPSKPGTNGLIADASCTNPRWTCDHREPAVVAMVKFHKYVGDAPKENVYDSRLNLLAFSRGDKGWAGFNNNGIARSATLDTGLAPGRYCDTVTGGKKGSTCAGTTVTVGDDGQATVELPARGAVAVTKQDRL